mmetsp:Transcript_4750/g.16390  ORF Transcript_4750/g.16390 Transcript_4750/m.16390 type:complete len:211 (+) Transcript_4750:761-1393(+)
MPLPSLARSRKTQTRSPLWSVHAASWLKSCSASVDELPSLTRYDTKTSMLSAETRVLVAAAVSCSSISAALPKRFGTARVNARITTSATLAGHAGTSARRSGTGLSALAMSCMSETASVVSNGRFPAMLSKSTTPSAHRSVPGPMAPHVEESICSGARYAAVPTMACAAVVVHKLMSAEEAEADSTFARPRSMILIWARDETWPRRADGA